MLNLTPFNSDSQTNNSLLNFSVKAGITNFSTSLSVLEIHYLISGPINELILPELCVLKNRANDLWKSTCFELFCSASKKSEAPYFELNISPNGDWNFYSLSSYRKDLAPEPRVETISLDAKQSEDSYLLKVKVPNFPLQSPFYVSLCTILEFKSGAKSYWALTHSSANADFHNKESFLLKL
jgi:hypothetical protein